MSRNPLIHLCVTLIAAIVLQGLAGAAELTPQVYVDFLGELDGTVYTLGPRELDATGSFAAHNGTEQVSDGLGSLTDADGAAQESFEFDASAFNNGATTFTGTAFVVEAIFTSTTVSDNMAPIIDIGGQCFIRFHDGLSAGCWNGATEEVNNNIQDVPLVGETHHYAIVYDGASTIVYYMDGEVIFQSANGSPQQITALVSWGNIRHSSVDGGRQLRGQYDSVAFSTYTGDFDPETDFVLPGGLIPASIAFAPQPADGAVDVVADVALNWMAGDTAATHDVYFGTSFEDVNNADRANPMAVLTAQDQVETTFDFGGPLEYGQTYYWRVDEVNGPTDYTVFKGDVWTFTVEPFVYPVQDIIVTSNTEFAEGQGPDRVVDGSGLNEADQHSTQPTTMWLGEAPGDEPPYIEFEFDRVYKLHEMLVWNYNMAFEMLLGLGVKEASVEYSVNGAQWTLLDDVVLNQAPGNASYTYDTIIPFGGVAAKFVRMTIATSFISTASHGLSEVRFTYIPAHPREPEPVDGATGVELDPTLGWRPGREAVSHDVYFSSDPEALALLGTTTQNSYATGTLALDTTYYWQVVEVNEADAITSWTGDLWSFTTQEYLEVDDFESYDDDIEAGTTIWQSWIDGIDDATNGGSTVGYAQSPFAEMTIVNTGNQSMPFSYENAGPGSISEADLMLSPAQDWSPHRSLTFWFYGADGSTGQLYAKINGTKVLYDGSAANLGVAAWQAWSIDLSQFADLTSVTTLSIGVEGAGTGMLYIDDVRLYARVLDD